MENITVCTKHKNVVDENSECKYAVETTLFAKINDLYEKVAEVYPYTCECTSKCCCKQTIQIYEEGDE